MTQIVAVVGKVEAVAVKSGTSKVVLVVVVVTVTLAKPSWEPIVVGLHQHV